MKRYFLLILTAFLLGSISGYAGLLLALHHIQEPLTQSVHYVWYDWFMYMAWPGFVLASCFFDPMNPASRSYCIPSISLANGLITSFAISLIFLSSQLIRMTWCKMPCAIFL